MGRPKCEEVLRRADADEAAQRAREAEARRKEAEERANAAAEALLLPCPPRR